MSLCDLGSSERRLEASQKPTVLADDFHGFNCLRQNGGLLGGYNNL